MSQQVRDGADAEKNFVTEMNENKNNSRWNELGIAETGKFFAVRVNTHKMSKIHGKKVPCKSDVFIARSEKNVDKFDLSEDDLENYELKPIPNTGISIKKKDATNIQWQKLGIDAVRELFGNTELGAGISIYERKGSNHQNLTETMEASQTIVKKWCDSKENFEKYYKKEVPNISKLFDTTQNNEERLEIAKKIGKIADKKMKEMIDNDEKLQKKIFWGIGVFEEPFCATYVFEDNKLRKTKGYFPNYSITTGSNRIETFTISIKGSK